MDCHEESAWTPISEDLKLQDSHSGLLFLPFGQSLRTCREWD